MKTQVDAVTVEIVGNLLLSIAEEMGVALIKSAYSTNIKERRDISTAVFDPEGNMVAQAEHVAMHLGSLLGIIKEVYKKHPAQDIRPGDMFMGNDPYNGGGTHLPDITVTQPVFVGDKLIGWVANLAHHSDVGGKVAGSTSGDAVSIFQEGLKIPLVRICEKDEVNEDIISFLMANSRIPGERYGDLQAQIASNRVGAKRLTEALTAMAICWWTVCMSFRIMRREDCGQGSVSCRTASMSLRIIWMTRESGIRGRSRSR